MARAGFARQMSTAISTIASFSTSLFSPYWGQSIGTKLMLAMLTELAAAGYQRAFFSGKKESRALCLCQRIDFKIVGDGARYRVGYGARFEKK
ncbi:hypothetical protein [Trueperella pyogenes]|uniref:hypothetical protein n=4 Tax=Trueperella pyogenes TaxID=1661 RepID=UPI0031329E90